MLQPRYSTCPLVGICRLSRAFQEATSAFMAVLDGLTVADIAANKGALMNRIEKTRALPEGARK
jgi:Rrf2 family nitric oxide-sensitive transcriptional repressor